MSKNLKRSFISFEKDRQVVQQAQILCKSISDVIHEVNSFLHKHDLLKSNEVIAFSISDAFCFHVIATVYWESDLVLNNGWHYIQASFQHGTDVDSVFEELAIRTRTKIAENLGRTTRGISITKIIISKSTKVFEKSVWVKPTDPVPW